MRSDRHPEAPRVVPSPHTPEYRPADCYAGYATLKSCRDGTQLGLHSASDKRRIEKRHLRRDPLNQSTAGIQNTLDVREEDETVCVQGYCHSRCCFVSIDVEQ